MSTPTTSPSLFLRNIIPENIINDSDNFVAFMAAYYDWLNTSTIYLYERTGAFQQNETIVSQTNKTSCKISQVKDSDTIVIDDLKGRILERGEIIVGQTSGATATVFRIETNINYQTNNLINYRDVDKSIDKFSDYLKYELYDYITNDVTKSKIVRKKIRDLYESKGQESSIKYLLKLVYDQNVDILYPSEEILRISDGKYIQSNIIRVNTSSLAFSDDVFNYKFKTIIGQNSGAIATVSDVKKLQLQDVANVSEFNLKSISGSFIPTEKIYVIGQQSNAQANYVTTYGIVNNYIVNYGGSGYTPGEFLDVTGDGVLAKIKVAEIEVSGIDRIKINTTGHGYRLGTQLSVNNTDTGGSGLIAKVSEISNTYTVISGANTYVLGEITKVSIQNKGSNYADVPTLSLIDQEITNLGLLTDKLITIVNPGTNYTVGDAVSFSGSNTGTATAEVGSVNVGTTDYDIFLEDGTKLLSEYKNDFIKYDRTIVAQPAWSGVGPITRIQMLNFGSGYSLNSLPTAQITTSTGSSANLTVTGIQGSGANVQVDVANNYGGLGSIKSLEISDFGVNYSNANVVTTTKGNGDANVFPVIGGLGVKFNVENNDDGKLNYKKIQDSFYYQDFSYVIRGGLEVDVYRELLKKLVHPAGLNLFGQIVIYSDIDLTMRSMSQVSIENLAETVLQIISQLSVKNAAAARTIELKIQPTVIDTFAGQKKTVVFGDEVMYYYASNTILQYANYTFLTPFPGYVYLTPEADIDIIIRGKSNVTYIPTSKSNTEVFFSSLANAESIVLGPNGSPILFATYVLNNYQTNTVNEFSNTEFDTLTNPESFQDILEKQQKVGGTVTYYSSNNIVSGSATTFQNDFTANGFIIIEADKFRVNNVTSNTSLSVSVGTTYNYTNKSAYKVV